MILSPGRLPGLVAVLIAGLLATMFGPVPPAGASAAFVAASWSGSSSSRTSITIGRPAGTQPGHVMVASIVSNGDTPAFAAPAGWSLVRQDAIDDVRQGVYVKVAGSSEPGSYTWSLSDWRRVAGGITTYAGVDTADPVVTHGSSVNTTASTAVTAPSITTSVPNTLLVHLAAVNAEGTLNPPGGMAERWEAASPNGSNSRDVLASSSEALQTATGPTGTRTATSSQSGRSIGTLLALRPAGPPPPPDTDPPDTTIDSGPSGTVAESSATFTFSATEPSTFQCRLDGAAFASCSSPKTYASLANGSHTFAVRATDTAGNVEPTPATQTWIVDAPPVPVPDGIISTVAGTGTGGFSGDGGPATTARLRAPRTMTTDAAGNIYVADTENHRIRRIDPSGVISTVAGTGVGGFSGDGGPATKAQLKMPHGVAVDGTGNVYVADSPNQRIRRIDPSGRITTVAGTGKRGYNGDGIAATAAKLNYPKGVEIGPDGALYIADANNNRVRRVVSGVISTVAGTGSAGFSGDGGQATSARLRKPRNTAFDAAGNLYIADDENFRVRRVSPSGTITTVAGNGVAGYGGDGGPATAAKLKRVRDVAVGADGSLYIADEQNHRIRRVTSGTISTYAGTGVKGFSGDGGPVADAKIAGPRGVAVDASGRVIIADTGNHRLRLVT